MSLPARIRDQWRHWKASRTMTGQEQLLDLLRQEYIEESQDVLRLSCHAERMYYPQFRESLLRIAPRNRRMSIGSASSCLHAGKTFQP